MTAKIIDGKLIAKGIRGQICDEIGKLRQAHLPVPKLAVILAGDDPASQIYVRNKERACQEVGMLSEVVRMPASVSQEALRAEIERLNRDLSVHGILVQLPLPKGLDEGAALNAISPAKDIDGLNTFNMGKLIKGEKDGFVPCTPQGIIELILSTGTSIEGKEAVVVGRSNIVGKPTALLLLQKNATVTLCHSRTQNLGTVTRRAEILVAAVGSPGIIRAEMVKVGAVVIDVGTNRAGEKLLGDVDFEAVKEKAGYLSPVPGGVGPMTIAMLLKNTLKAAVSA